MESRISDKSKRLFWEKVDKQPGLGPSGVCWEWTAFINPSGYGQLTVRYKGILAHRLSFELAHGGISPNVFICHTCDNPKCVNPSHLFAGSHLDNMADMVAKKRGGNAFKDATHCTKGHEYTVENTRLYKGKRVCRRCINAYYRTPERHAIRNAKLKAQRLAKKAASVHE